MLIEIINTGDPVMKPDGTPAAGCILDILIVDAETRRPCSVWDAVSGELVTMTTVTVTLDADGEIPLDPDAGISTLFLWPNDRGNVATLYRVTARDNEITGFYAALASSPLQQTLLGFMAGGTALTPAELSALALHTASPVHLPPGGITGEVLAKHSDNDYDTEWVTQTGGTGGGGTGDVVGPTSAIGNNFAAFNSTTGKLIKDSGSKATDFAPALGSDDNYVTGAEKSDLHAPNSDNQDLSGLIPKSLATAADMTLVSSGAGTWLAKTLAEFKTWLGLGSAAYTASSAYATAAQGTDARTPTTHGSDKHSVTYLVSGTATASDVGALPIAGGTMTGTLVGKASDSGTGRVYNIHVGTSAPSDTSMLFLDTSI